MSDETRAKISASMRGRPRKKRIEANGKIDAITALDERIEELQQIRARLVELLR
jgi:hypothetical protein